MAVVKHNKIYQAERVGRQLRTLARLHGELQRHSADCCGVASLPQCFVLTTLGREGPMTLAKLARRLELDKAWVSRTVETMSQAGLIDKRPSESDKRSVTLRLTDEGERQYHALDARLSAQSGRVLNHVPEAERDHVLRALDLLASALNAEVMRLRGEERAD